MKNLICSHCGNIVNMISDSGVPVMCCGAKMEELVPNTVEFEAEKPLATEVTSDFLYEYTLDKIKQIDEQKELYNELLNEMEQLKLEKEQKEENKNTEE